MPSRDPYKYFRVEARELIDALEHGAVELGRSGEPAQTVSLLLRHAHTLKGAARVVRQPAMSDLAHRIEDVLMPLRDNPGATSPASIDQVRRHLAALTAALAALDPPAATPAPAEAAKVPPVTTAPLIDTVKLQVTEVDATTAGLAAAVGDSGKLTDQFRALERIAQRARALQRRLDPAPALAGETAEILRELDVWRRQAEAGADRLGEDLQRLHDDTGRMRLLPTGPLWAFLEQATRDAAESLGKRLRLEIHSRLTRIDVTVFATLQEALLHVIRNSAAHASRCRTIV